MIELSNYQILKKLSEGVNHDVYLGRGKHDGQPCVIKVARGGRDGARQRAMLRYEYELIRGLGLDGIVKPLALESHAGFAALILEYAGESLALLLETASYELGLERVLWLAIQLTDTLGALHRAHVIHKDINPGNILVDTKTHRARIGDLSTSSLLSIERFTPGSGFGAIEGTLEYISPEQTGRMNRSIDCRSDFYSLGATLYEMLTGRAPFETNDPMEMVHCHIARMPVPPHEVDPKIPRMVSAVVMKLLSKTAEERYQSSFRLKADLEACLGAVRLGTNLEGFVPGRGDRPERLHISQKLHGRDEDVTVLMAAFDRISGVVDTSGPELLLVAGCSGIGKSTLVNELHKPLVRQRGYFIAGRCGPFNRDIPYSSIVLAFRELLQQLLTEGEARLAWWRQRLLEALGPNGQVILEVLPEVELIIGKQPPLGPLGPAETKNRFDMTFRRFISVFATEGRPLVVFLDDLQWADASSLELIGMLLDSEEIHHLLIIGAYRDDAVEVSHPLVVMLNELGSAKSRVRTLTLEPLAPDDVHQLVADTLGDDRDRVWPLSSFLARKTHGNPFFLIQLLTRLHQQGHLSFDASSGEWQWDMRKLEALGLTENVSDLMSGRIRDLDEGTQHVIRLAACLGNRFDLARLSFIHQKPARQTADALWKALQVGLLVPIGNDYKMIRFLDEIDGSAIRYEFLHDRVQQAAYTFVPNTPTSEGPALDLTPVVKVSQTLDRELVLERLLLENSKLYEKLEDYSRTLEQKIRELQQQIVVQEKLASLGTLTAGIAHEIKNPLNFVKNFSEFSNGIIGELREEIDVAKAELKEKSREVIEELLEDLGQNVQKIHEHGTRIDNIVRSMLSLSRDSASTREPTKLNALVAEYLNLAYHGMRAADSSFNVTLKTEFDSSLTEIPVVPHDIGRALLNISNNAFYATQEKQRLVGGAFSPEVRVTTKDLGEYAEVRIRDNGMGIPASVVDNIFTPFFTTKPTGKGTGLGLSICHDIVVQEHQGSISVDTAPGQYTEFIVRLPKHPAEGSSTPGSRGPGDRAAPHSRG